MLRASLRIHEELGHKEGMANAHGNFGGFAARRGDTTEARRQLTLARDLFAEIGAEPMRARVQGWLDELDG